MGLVVSDAPTDTFQTPAVLGTWLAGIGGNTVKASTEHYTVMQDVLSDQRYPGDPDAVYSLDDNLIVIGGDYDGQAVVDVIPIVGDVNGDGVADIKDVLIPNESTIAENIAASDDYSVTLKDDGKLLYRWGNTVKRPNDIRVEVEMELPDEWSQPTATAPDLLPLYQVTMAELLVNHTITNNPNDQIRPEDYENESAIGQLPTYEILSDGRWVSTDDYYAGDGTFYPAGTVLKDPALVQAVEGTLLDQMGALSADLQEGFTKAWYTTMDREPFQADLNDDGTEYDIGPRWRLQPDKYGQDLPSVVIPADPSLPPPPTKDEVKYEVGEDTQTVINLLDWENPISPLSISAGWQNNAGTVSENGLNLSKNFDIAFYVKGDVKPATLYNTELVMDYGEITIHGEDGFIAGGISSDYLVGQGGNTFIGDANTAESGEDLFVVSYGVTTDWSQISSSTVLDFEFGVDTLGLIDLGVHESNFDDAVNQTVADGDLTISLDTFELVTLDGVDEMLDLSSFTLLNRQYSPQIEGTSGDDYLVGDEFNNIISGFDGNDTLLGLAGDDTMYGGTGNDEMNGGADFDRMYGESGDDTMNGGEDNDIVNGGIGNDILIGGGGIDLMGGAQGNDVMAGEDGHDNMYGNLGDDNMNGGEGNDFMEGHDGADVLRGMSGNDRINGGNGNDNLGGGAGADRFIYSDGWGDDIIADFENGIDIIDMSNVAGVNGISDLTITFSDGSTYLSYQGDEIRLFAENIANIGAEDFVF